MNIVLEYIIVFICVLIIIYFISKFNKKNLSKGMLTPELLYLKKVYHINPKDIGIDKLSRIVIILNTFIITTIYIILTHLLFNWILRFIVGIILIILLIVICYGLLGRYYLKERRK